MEPACCHVIVGKSRIRPGYTPLASERLSNWIERQAAYLYLHLSISIDIHAYTIDTWENTVLSRPSLHCVCYQNGGAISYGSPSPLTIDNCIFLSNAAVR